MPFSQIIPPPSFLIDFFFMKIDFLITEIHTRAMNAILSYYLNILIAKKQKKKKKFKYSGEKKENNLKS